MLDVTEKKAHIMKATPKLVDWLLTMNNNNRNLKRGHLKWLSHAITNNEFILTGQGISVSSSGKLIDGQHRLMALREAGYPPVEIMVVTGLDERARIYIDQQSKRSTADMLKIVLNKQITTRMAAVINFHLMLKEDKKNGFTRPTSKPSLEQVVEQMAEYGEYLGELLAATGQKCKAGVQTALFHYGLKYDADRAIMFGEQIRLGEGLKRVDPAYKLREYVMGSRSAGGSAAMEDYKMGVTACIADALNQDILSFRPSSTWAELPPKLKRYSVAKDGSVTEAKLVRRAA